MATQNLFEKYGIKEVADVTFYRIEKKEETYESQRAISAASILKSAVELQTVYPIVNGVGAEEGFEAYVFKDANVLTGTNYDCDDIDDIIENLRVVYVSSTDLTDTEIETLVNSKAKNLVLWTVLGAGAVDGFSNPTVLSYTNKRSNIEMTANKVSVYNNIGDDVSADTVVVGKKVNYATVERTITVTTAADGSKIVLTPDSNTTINSITSSDETSVSINATNTEITPIANKDKVTITVTYTDKNATGANVAKNTFDVSVTTDDGDLKISINNATDGSITLKASNIRIPASYVYTINTNITFTATNSTDLSTGVYNTNADTSRVPDTPYEDGIGTHEYSYAQQICMAFARHQNLISKTGVRYQFNGTDTIFGEIGFNDEFTTSPRSTNKIVVVGLTGKFTEGTYDIEEIDTYLKTLTTVFNAKAYNAIYDDYAELVVEDEMGYYRKDFLGYTYNKDNGSGSATVDFFTTGMTYNDWIETNGLLKDAAIANAIMWEDGIHYSINDAIEALRQKQLILDASEPSGIKGLKTVFGGYKVSSKENNATGTPNAGTEDIHNEGYETNTYNYTYNGLTVSEGAITSEYPLSDVQETINELAMSGKVYGKNVRVDGGPTSNRAIYIGDNSVDTAAGAYIYLLHNKNSKTLSSDKDGIFSFEDKKGNTLYYQDKIFKGIEYLALVILGNKGLIFVVNRNGNVDVERVAWMVNETGYVDDKRAATLVKNGLIHTTDITVNDETFEATCTVKSLKVRKITKKTNHYIPVLFLDTLKVSTIEQTAEEVYATGGKGNSNLIGWDYGKEITLNLQDALFTPASMSAIFGSYDGNDFRKGVKEVKNLDRFEKVTARRNFIVPAGNSNGTPTEADKTAQAVFYDPTTMEPYPDGTPIAEGEVFYKFTRSVAYEGQSLGHMIEISADKFPGTYKIVGDTFVRSKETGEDERFQFVIPQAKMTSEQTITLEADGDPSVFDMNMTVLRPDDGVMVRFIQYNVVENEEENDGSTMVKNTENLNLLDDAELFKVSADSTDETDAIGSTEY